MAPSAYKDGDLAQREYVLAPTLAYSLLTSIFLVTSAEDVAIAIEHGVDGVLISNHGGRQLDGVPASLDVLRECAPVARNRIKLGVDGGFRRGSDIFKALALGADFCLAGRVPLWGLAVSHS